jgi:hypothetical protein
VKTSSLCLGAFWITVNSEEAMIQDHPSPLAGIGQIQTDSTCTSTQSTTRPTRGFNRRIKDASAGQGFAQIPHAADDLPDGVYKFLGKLRTMSRHRGYVEMTNPQLAKRIGKVRSTVAGYLALLTSLVVAGRDHTFVYSVMIDGKRRLYPVDAWGNRVVPPEVMTRARLENRARSSRKSGAPAAAATNEAFARVVPVQKLGNENDPSNPLERQRSASPGNCVECMTESTPAVQVALDRPQDPEVLAPMPAPSSAATSPTIPVAQAVEIQETPSVKAWTDLAGPKAEAKKTPEQQTLDVLTPEERLLFNAQPEAMRARQAREFCNRPSPAAVSYLKKKLAMAPPDNGPVVSPETPTAEVIRRIPASNDPFLVQIASQRLVNTFKDPKYWHAFDLLMRAIWLGNVNAEAVAFAFEQTTKRMKRGPLRKPPGAYFTHIVCKEAHIRGEDLPQLARGERRHV